MSTISGIGSSQFQNTILKLRKEKSYIINNSKHAEKKAEEGENIVFRGSPRFILILWSIFLLIIAVMLAIWIYGFNFFNLLTFIIVISVWFGTGVLFTIGTMSLLIILTPDGFLVRRFLFFRFSQKWKSLTIAPEVAVETDPQGGKYYNLKFTGSWGTRRINTRSIGIKDIKKANEKMNFIGKIAQIYYEKSLKS
jgi:hypothetical protein